VSFASNAIKGDPSLAEALYLRALGLFNLGRIDEARIALASCLEIDPRHEGASKLKSQWVERGLWHESP
jgi:tetratricopeptide (TPR) repeat protein